RHLRAAEQAGVVERADLEHHGGQARPPCDQMGTAFGAEFARHCAFEIAAGKFLRRALGVAEAVDRHQHEHVGRAAADILAFAAMTLRLEHRLAFGPITQRAAITSAFQSHAVLPLLERQCAAFARAAWACLSMASMICGHIRIGSACPMPSIIRSLAPGIEAAVSLPPSGRTSGSTVPWITSVGALTNASRFLRLPDARMARSCRPTPAGFKPRSNVRSARARSSASSSGKLPARRTFQVCAWRTKYSSLLAGGGAISTAVASRVGGGTFGLPVVDMIEVSDRTRSGNEIAISCAIMPPIEAPTRCADLMPSTFIRPMTSSAMSWSL